MEFPLDCRDDESATAELNELLYSRIMDRLKSNHLDPNLVCRFREGNKCLFMTRDAVFPGLACST